ncbi:MAG TPA: NAD(P)-dependent alcohol dehydrogenase [Longimicrobiales bacterium]|nr:NAD(P)-dependent alcohol dehydrogenase [Longimicrobiales bacterium]
MKALQLHAWKSEPELRDVAVPEPGPGQVLVRVLAAGACHSDLHLMHDFEPDQLDYDLPFTLGHETAGVIEALGAGVEEGYGIEVGAPVAVYGPWGCGRCHNCRIGMENYCMHADEIGASGAGLGRDGGMAEHVLVPSPRLLVPLGDLDPVKAAPLTDAGLTPYHAIKRSLPKLVPGSTAAVIGVGGLGHVAVQLLDALSPARVVAIDLDERKLALAREVGADHAIPSDDSAADEIRRLTGGRGCELVLDFVGAQATVDLAARIGRTLGDIALVGLGGGTLGVSFFGVPQEVSVATTYWGSITELMEVVALARRGLVDVHVTRYSLDDALTAYRDLRAGKIDGRAVMVPA